MTYDPSQLGQLLEEKKYDEARALIQAVAEQPLSEEEHGKALVDIASMYLDIANSVQGQHIEALQEALDNLEAVHGEENASNDAAKLDAVRERLSGGA